MTDHNRHLLPFVEARAFARSLALPHRAAWRDWAKSHRAELKAHGVPSRPDVAYKRKDEPEDGHRDVWNGWTDWLRTDPRTISSRRFSPKHFMPFADWKEWVRQQGFTKKEDYNDWCKSQPLKERRRLGIPSSPALIYAAFPGWNTALGKVAPRDKGRTAAAYAPFREARALARSLNLPNAKAWRDWARKDTNRRLLATYRIPSTPDRVAAYRTDFRGWRDFLGTDRRPTINRKR